MTGVRTVHRGTVDDGTTAAAILAAALDRDRVIRWLLPDPQERPIRQMLFYRLVVDHILQRQDLQQGELQLYFDGEAHTGAALWLNVDAADRVSGPAMGLIEEALGPDAFARYRKLDEQLRWIHPLDVRHAYLRLIGVVPGQQGHGIGSRLLEAQLEQFDAAGTPVYLVASYEFGFYLCQRHGFRPVGNRIPLATGGPFIYPLGRQPQRQRSAENAGRWKGLPP